jgi:hypothetical protein
MIGNLMKPARRFLALVGLLLATLPPKSSAAQQVTAQDLDAIQARADKLFDEAKASYDEARSKSLLPRFIDAGFKLEEARIKFLVLQEVGSPEKQKFAADRMRAINQLNKLIHDGKVAVGGLSSEGTYPKGEPPSPSKDPVPEVRPLPVPAPEPVDVSKRLPIPEVARQQDAEKLVREMFKDQYARKTPADRKALARLLLEQTPKNLNDPAALWVLCREAQDVAVQAGDSKSALESIEIAARVFDVDPLPLKTAALTGAGRAAKTSDEFGAIAGGMLRHVTELVLADQYDAADKTVNAALGYAKKTSDGPLIARATTRARDVAEAKTLYQSMKSVLETQAKNPDDPAANLEIGRFLCFVKGSWDLGLRFIVKGSDAALKTLADKELGLADQAGDRAVMADGWWDLAGKEKSALRKSQMLAHASLLYEAALESSSGLARTRIEKRLSELNAVDLLAMIDLKSDVLSGAWHWQGGKLVAPPPGNPQKMSIVRIPYLPPPEYDLRIVMEYKPGPGGLNSFDFGLVGTNGQFTTIMGATGGAALHRLDGKFDRTETLTKERVFAPDRPSTLFFSVRKTGVSLTSDGRSIIQWKGDMNRLSLDTDTFGAVADKRTFFFGTWQAYQISSIDFLPVAGLGQKSR